MSYALVPAKRYVAAKYGLRAAQRLSPKTRAAIGVAKFVYKNRGKASRAARIIGRAWKKRAARKRKARNDLGDSKVFPVAKRSGTLLSQNILVNTKTLYFEPLIDIGRTATNELQGRQRDAVRLSGIKIDMEIRNNSTNSSPLYFHVAILKPKNKETDQVPDDTSSTFTSFGDFFRSDGGNARSEDFNSSLTGLELHTLPINTDRWHIFSHIKYTLLPSDNGNTAYNTQRGSSWKVYQKYHKINRIVKFDSPTDNVPTTGNVFMCYWCSFFGELSTPAQVNEAVVSEKIHCYWREPQAVLKY